MKKLGLLLLLTLSIFVLSACDPKTDTEPDPDPVPIVNYTVTFNIAGGSAVSSQEVESGTITTVPVAPTKEGYTFTIWYETDDTVAFDFLTPITADITLTAYWTEVVPEITDMDLVDEDIQYLIDNLYDEDGILNLVSTAKVNRSRVTWEIDSIYVTSEGIVLPLPNGSDATTTTITATVKFNDATKTKSFDIPLTTTEEVVLTTVKSIPFENLTTEYDVDDDDVTVDLYFETDGNVPYIKLTDFFSLVEGFIDPATVFVESTVEGVLTISYEYYDEEEDYTYDMILTVDSTENTIDVNDPAFYWAYVYSVETNYGRHIEYMDETYPGYSYDEGTNINYDLDDFNLDIVLYQDEVLLPYYMANQLFAGSSYYNVYYNVDGLYGIYSLPSTGSDELNTIRSSSENYHDIPVDILIHTFNMLAFNLDNLYGLKDIMDIDTYYTLLYENADSLLDNNAGDFELALRDFLLLTLDEPHTSYGYPSFYNAPQNEGPLTNSLAFYGERMNEWYNDGLFATDDAIGAKWGKASGTNWNAVNKPDYWFVDDVTVMLSLNDFYTSDIEVSYTFDYTLAENALEVEDGSLILPSITEGNKFWYYKNSTQENTIVEIIVKGVEETYVTDYKAALVSLGATLVQQDTDEDEKDNGYYTLTVGGVVYMVQVAYDAEYDAFYVGVNDTAPAAYEDEWVLIADTHDTVNGDSAVYMELVFEQIIAEKPLVEDVILDLTWNTGGNVGALYRIVGFITDDPFQTSRIDGDTNGTSTSYVDIDDGIPSYAHLNWALLTTPTTFSAANDLANLFKANDFGPIIGIQSGGGACSITPILLPTGSAFTMSSNGIGAYRTGAGTVEDPYEYHNTEFGIVPDYPLSMTNIYDEATLLAILDTVY